ncbi:MAG TPA: biotin/lipoyl-containing protein [Candidatus Limnocylindrales bacterium]|nr:biotin/lipoyl-containing protein [Candidatus Limnocylindrales bacterium]
MTEPEQPTTTTPQPSPSAPAPGDPATADRAPTPAAADASLLALVDRLAAVLEGSDLLELEVEAGGTGLVLRRAEALMPPAAPGAPPAGSGPAGAGQAEPARGPGEAPSQAAPIGRPSVKAPLTGIWYAAPSPGSAPFVTVGQEIVAGQVIGLIEAMKLFNEIKSDLSGRVVRVAAENGQLVKAKQPLLEVEPL